MADTMKRIIPACGVDGRVALTFSPLLSLRVTRVTDTRAAGGG